jgi:putative tryptophan/tyrosine transport system substrate-binding protein
MTTRRQFVALLGGSAAWPLAARTQQSGKLPTIGFMGSTTPSVAAQWVASFVQRLRELGWLEGRDVAIESEFQHPFACPKKRHSTRN